MVIKIVSPKELKLLLETGKTVTLWSSEGEVLRLLEFFLSPLSSPVAVNSNMLALTDRGLSTSEWLENTVKIQQKVG